MIRKYFHKTGFSIHNVTSLSPPVSRCLACLSC